MDHWLIHLLWLTHFERPMWLWCMVAVLPGKPKPCDHCPGGSGGLPHGITETTFNVRGMVLRILAESLIFTLEPMILVERVRQRHLAFSERLVSYKSSLWFYCGQLFCWPNWCSSAILQTGFSLRTTLQGLIAAYSFPTCGLGMPRALGLHYKSWHFLLAPFIYWSSIDHEPNGSPEH